VIAIPLTEDQLEVGRKYQFAGNAKDRPVTRVLKITNHEVHTIAARWWKPEFMEKFVVFQENNENDA
jgi:hypothetical protein